MKFNKIHLFIWNNIKINIYISIYWGRHPLRSRAGWGGTKAKCWGSSSGGKMEIVDLCGIGMCWNYYTKYSNTTSYCNLITFRQLQRVLLSSDIIRLNKKLRNIRIGARKEGGLVVELQEFLRERPEGGRKN